MYSSKSYDEQVQERNNTKLMIEFIKSKTKKIRTLREVKKLSIIQSQAREEMQMEQDEILKESIISRKFKEDKARNLSKS